MYVPHGTIEKSNQKINAFLQRSYVWFSLETYTRFLLQHFGHELSNA